jgi:hypothetical protein
MSQVIYNGKINGEFEGFDDEMFFKMLNGTYWIQAHYKYWYHYVYSPNVTITQDNGIYVLSVAGNSVPIRRISNVIESRINGDFNGWEGNSKYQLLNGQTWQQSTYKYQYKYAYMPAAVVYYARSGYKMRVAGTTATVLRLE